MGPNGSIVGEDGRPHLESEEGPLGLIPGVELLRLVVYDLKTNDDFTMAVQAEFEARAGRQR